MFPYVKMLEHIWEATVLGSAGTKLSNEETRTTHSKQHADPERQVLWLQRIHRHPMKCASGHCVLVGGTNIPYLKDHGT